MFKKVTLIAHLQFLIYFGIAKLNEYRISLNKQFVAVLLSIFSIINNLYEFGSKQQRYLIVKTNLIATIVLAVRLLLSRQPCYVLRAIAFSVARH